MTIAQRTTRNRIEAQGFTGLSNSDISALKYWFRLSPTLCLAWTLAGLLSGSSTVLFALVPFTLLGGMLRGHPFDAIYNNGVRFLTGTPSLPRYGKPRRFGCLVAAAVVTAAALGFQFGYPMVSYLLGGFLAAGLSINVLTGFCLASFIYGTLFGRPSCGLPNNKVRLADVPATAHQAGDIRFV